MTADTVKHTPLACCPFCGETPSEIVDATKILGVYRIVHRCKVIPPFVLEGATPENVAAAWNRRAPDPVREAAQALLRHWDTHGAEVFKTSDMVPEGYFTPAGRMVDSEFVANLRSALLAKGEKA